MKEYASIIVPIIVAVFSSGLIQYIITRFDNKNGMKKEIGKLGEKIDAVDTKFDKKVGAVEETLAEHRAVLARTHILRFADELHNGTIHSDEYFRQQILDIDTYNKYCETHPNFANGLTKMASEFIKKEYRKLYLTKED